MKQPSEKKFEKMARDQMIKQALYARFIRLDMIDVIHSRFDEASAKAEKAKLGERPTERLIKKALRDAFGEEIDAAFKIGKKAAPGHLRAIIGKKAADPLLKKHGR